MSILTDAINSPDKSLILCIPFALRNTEPNEHGDHYELSTCENCQNKMWLGERSAMLIHACPSKFLAVCMLCALGAGLVNEMADLKVLSKADA